MNDQSPTPQVIETGVLLSAIRGPLLELDGVDASGQLVYRLTHAGKHYVEQIGTSGGEQ